MDRRTVFAAIGLLLVQIGAAVSNAEVVAIDPHAQYPEGPLWFGNRLFYVEYAASNVTAWDGRERKIIWHADGCGSNGLVPFGRGHLLVACYDGNYLVELDPSGSVVRKISADQDGKSFIGPNDFAADAHGGIYFTASGVFDVKAPISGTVLYLAADGTVREIANTIHYSNGLTLDREGKHLLVAEMLAGRILSFPILASGKLGPRVVWARLQDLAPPTADEDAYNGPDGIKLGPDGNYYIAQNGSGRVLVVSAERKLVQSISVPTRYVTNIAFGPGGAAELYITGAFDPWKAPYPGAVYKWTPDATNSSHQ